MKSPKSFESKLESFVESLRLSHFAYTELLIGLEDGNRIPPPSLFGNIAPTLIVADAIRNHYGAPVKITSAYRTEEYNKAEGGAIRSQHMAFSALDIKVKGVSAREVANLVHSWQGRIFRSPVRFARVWPGHLGIPHKDLQVWLNGVDDGFVFEFIGGVGWYPSFTHIDCRGIPSTWGQR